MELFNRRLLLLNENEPSPLSTSLFVTPLKLSAPVPFNSDVAFVIIILLLLIAFLVLFLRRYSHHSPSPASSNHHSPSSSCGCGGGGLDPTTVQSLPVFPYNSEAKNHDDCPICLTEFETGETVKMVPNCKHVFHRECIDTWLSSHVTCPICRGSEFFAVDRPEEESESGKAALTSQRVGSTVEDGATCHQRRSWSCSSFDRDTVVLRRTLSY